MTPFEVIYGWVPPILSTHTTGSSVVDEVDHVLCDHTQFLRLLKDNLIVAQACMKQQVDKHRSKCEFDVGN